MDLHHLLHAGLPAHSALPPTGADIPASGSFAPEAAIRESKLELVHHKGKKALKFRPMQGDVTPMGRAAEGSRNQTTASASPTGTSTASDVTTPPATSRAIGKPGVANLPPDARDGLARDGALVADCMLANASENSP
jgi:hypothetical protein